MPSAAYLKRPQTARSLDECKQTTVDGFPSAFDVSCCWTGHQVVLWCSQVDVPTVPAITVARPATESIASSDTEFCNRIECDNTQLVRCRRSCSDSGIGGGPSAHRNPVSMQAPGLKVGTCLQRRLFRHSSQKDRYRLTYRNSWGGSRHSSSSSSSTGVSLAIDCTAIVDVVADGCNAATCAGSGATKEQSAGCQTTAAVSKVTSSSQDLTVLALRQRVQQLENRNRSLQKKLRLLRAKQEHHPKQEHISPSTTLQEQQQSEGSDQPSSKQLQACSLPAASAAPVPLEHVPQQLHHQPQQSQHQVERPDVSSDMLPSCGDAGTRGQQMLLQVDQRTEAAPDLLPSGTPQPAEGTNSTSCNTASSAAPLVLTDAADVILLCQIEQQHQGTIMSLQRQVYHLQMLQGLLRSDYADLECLLRETDRQRRDYAARYAFVVLDQDSDGYISTDQVVEYEPFATYAPDVVRAAFSHWRWQSGFPGYLNMEDFVRFVEYAEDRSSRSAQWFWFSVIDADGDGRVGWQDMKLMYDAVNKPAEAFVVSFQDLMNQIRSMIEHQQRPDLGFTFSEMWASRLGAGVIALLTNHNNMLLQRSTAEWGRGDYPL